MSYSEYSYKVERLKTLVEHRRTGSPQELGSLFGVSERTARRMIEYLKKEGPEIRYCRSNRSYYYGMD